MSGNRAKPRIFLCPPHMGGSEEQYVRAAFDSNWIAPLGPNVDLFERTLESYCNVGHAAVLTSGTAAIHLALVLLGVGHGDEVIASTLTFSATINPIVYQGAIPVLVDSEPGSWNMCPDTLERAIRERLSKGKKPKAIILVHLYGMPADLDRIMGIAAEHEIPVIEDAAEALGSRYRGKSLGTFGRMGALSFNGNKIITTSGGGALLSNEEKLIVEARYLASQSRDHARHYQHSRIGYNYRMSNVLAGIGIGQMEILELRVRQHRENFQSYRSCLHSINGIIFQEESNPESFSNYWLTALWIDPSITGKERDDIIDALERENIDSRPIWKPMHLQPVFKDAPSYLNGTSDHLFENGICLPSGSNLSKEDRERITKTIKDCLSQD